MSYDFHVHDAIRVEYRIATDGPSFPRGYCSIQSELRTPGGNGVIAAVALARWGARVLLTGNAIGDDSHGEFLQKELSQIEGLTFEPQVEAGLATPYAVLIQAGRYEAGAMLSPSAGPLNLPIRERDAHVARFFFGDHAAFEDEEFNEFTRLPASSQDYESLKATLSAVATVYLQLVGKEWPEEIKEAFIAGVAKLYSSRFGGLETIPNLEEVEAILAVDEAENAQDQVEAAAA